MKIGKSPSVKIGHELHAFASDLFPINRSLTGPGVRKTLAAIKERLPALDVFEVPSGTAAFDWTVPEEWSVREAWIEGPDGRRIVDFGDNNLHLVGYSTPVDTTVSLDALQEHLHSLPGQPDAIPYVTSYYRRDWGFCLSHRVREALPPGDYRVFIDSTLAPGSLSYGEFRLPGESDREILLSTYICHPSMANNELSGPVVATFIAQWLQRLPKRRFTYRVVFLPETIGTLVYLSRNLGVLKERVDAGFVLTCLGDEGGYSYLASRSGCTLADRVATHVMRHHLEEASTYSFLERGSDERQYCYPGIDLPVCSLMRTKYGEFPQYHTSLDDLSFVTPAGLEGGFRFVQRCLSYLESNLTYRTTTLGEPQLGRRGLYPQTGGKQATEETRLLLNVLGYADGDSDLLDIADRLGKPLEAVVGPAEALRSAGTLAVVQQPPSNNVSVS